MPGIAGIIGLQDQEASREAVAAMVSALRHEASYVEGYISDAAQHVCAGWVAHPSTFSSSMSGAYGARGLSVAFCGEVYNDNLADAMPSRFLDTLLPADAGLDRACVRQLNGQFSGLIIDSNRREALLFCDRYPMERIYVHQKDGVTYFASEAKALLLILPELRAFDARGVAQYLAFGCTFADQTLFEGISRLPGAALWRFRGGRLVSRGVYFKPEDWESQAELTEENYERDLASHFASVMGRYARSNGDLGISITGGLDTRMVMACLPRLDAPPLCYTYAGTSGETLDVRLGRRVALACGLEHLVIRIRDEFLQNFASLLDRTVYVTDGSAGPLATHEIYLTSKARQRAFVRLTGNYGSEILRSMTTLKPARLPAGFLSISGGELQEAAQCPKPPSHPVARSAFCEIPSLLFGTLAACRSQQLFRTPYLDNDIVKLAFRAPNAARRNSAAALQVIRENHAALARIHTDRAVRDNEAVALARLKRAVSALSFKLDYLDKEGLPGHLRGLDPVLSAMTGVGLLGRHKFLAYRRWFRSDLSSVVLSGAARARESPLPWVSARFLETMHNEHATGRANHLYQIDKVLTLESVYRQFLRGEAFTNIRPPLLDNCAAAAEARFRQQGFVQRMA